MGYEEFINNILETRGRFACGDKYHERHHIIPRCLGGNDDRDNLIDLYAREHFEAHRLLALENPSENGLQYAWWATCNLRSGSQNRAEISAEEYEEAKQMFSKILSKKNTGSGNPMFGRHLSDEAKEKISLSRKGQETWNKGKAHSEKTKTKISETLKQVMPNKREVRCVESGVVYDSFGDAERKTGICRRGISMACSGKRQTAGGFHWEYANKDIEKVC